MLNKHFCKWPQKRSEDKTKKTIRNDKIVIIDLAINYLNNHFKTIIYPAEKTLSLKSQRPLVVPKYMAHLQDEPKMGL